jgi:hypothetical protein
LSEKQIVLSDYLQYRAAQRSFDLNRVVEIVRFESERYLDMDSGRRVVIGRQKAELLLIPYDEDEVTIRPVTVHAITGKQIRFRVNTGRFTPL